MFSFQNNLFKVKYTPLMPFTLVKIRISLLTGLFHTTEKSATEKILTEKVKQILDICGEKPYPIFAAVYKSSFYVAKSINMYCCFKVMYLFKYFYFLLFLVFIIWLTHCLH